MASQALRMFIPITKIDAAQRLVYGLATAETKDRSGEVCDYATTKPYYEKWSGDIEKASGGKSLGNVRAMHGKVAAGKVTSLNFNDDAKQIEICAKVVDDAEWTKVEEGVYTGFSQGGSYIKKWKGEDGLQRYTADPSEVSLVDLPCLPDSTFQVIKANGEPELRKFVTVAAPPSNDEVAARAKEMAKAAGDEAKWFEHIEAARADLTKLADLPEPEAGEVEKDAGPKAEGAGTPVDGDEWEQVWKSKRDGATFKTKADLRKHHDALDRAAAEKAVKSPTLDKLDEISAALGIEKREFTAAEREKDAKSGAAMKDGSFPIENAEDLANAVKAYGRAKNKTAAKRHIIARAKALGKTDMLPDGWVAKVAGTEDLAKAASLSNVGSLISLLAQLENCEACLIGVPGSDDYYGYYSRSGTKIAVPQELLKRYALAMAEFGDITSEILDAILAEMGPEDAADAEKMSGMVGDLIKAGARHSKSDVELLQKAHDAIVAAGAACEPAAKGDEPGDLKKAASDLEKAAADLGKVTAERDALQKRLDGMAPQLDEILKRVKNIEAQPVGMPQLRVVSKAEDTAPAVAAASLEKLMDDPAAQEALSLLAIKMAQRQGLTQR